MTDQRRGVCGAVARQPGANRRALQSPLWDCARRPPYKWPRRHAWRARRACRTRSRRPHRSPAQTAPAIEQAVLTLRAQHPAWGPRKLPVLLGSGDPTPAGGLHDHGDPAPPRPAGSGPAAPLAAPRRQRFEHPQPNALWQMDFRGGRLWAGALPPATSCHDHSRYALGLAACPNQRTVATVRAQA